MLIDSQAVEKLYEKLRNREKTLRKLSMRPMVTVGESRSLEAEADGLQFAAEHLESCIESRPKKFNRASRYVSSLSA